MVPAESKDVLVAVGFAEATAAPEVVWSLVDAGFKVIAFSREGRAAALRQSRHVRVHEITAPEKDSRAALHDLAALLQARARSHRHVVLLPLDDSALWLSGQLPPSDACTLAGPSAAGVKLALDKGAQLQHAHRAGFNVPESAIVASVPAFHAGSFGLPVILRPAHAITERAGRLAKGRNWICSNEIELAPALQAWDGDGPVLVQPFIHGTGEGIFGLATPQGINAWSAHRRLRMMNPHGSGSSACMSHPVPPDAAAAAERFIRQVGWRGLFMIELLRDPTGKLWFIEFNGRPWGSMALSRRQGLEYPAWSVVSALNPNAAIEVGPRPPKTVVCRNAGREFMHLLFVLRGPCSKALKSWPPFWRTAFDLLSVHRGDTLYNWRRDDPKVFFSDCWNTIRDNLHKSRN